VFYHGKENEISGFRYITLHFNRRKFGGFVILIPG